MAERPLLSADDVRGMRLILKESTRKWLNEKGRKRNEKKKKEKIKKKNA